MTRHFPGFSRNVDVIRNCHSLLIQLVLDDGCPFNDGIYLFLKKIKTPTDWWWLLP